MALFPFFIELKDRKCICIGGGRVAARKIETLLEFEADITVVSPALTDTLKNLRLAGKIKIIARNYMPGDINGVFLAIAATNDRETNRQVYLEAVQNGVLVNVADAPKECTFTFPSIVKREELVLGITASGSYPAFSKKVRGIVEKACPEYFGNILKLLRDYRKRAQKDIPDAAKRAEVLDRLAAEAVQAFEEGFSEQFTGRLESIYEVYGK